MNITSHGGITRQFILSKVGKILNLYKLPIQFKQVKLNQDL